jgi:hypothetical protein
MFLDKTRSTLQELRFFIDQKEAVWKIVANIRQPQSTAFEVVPVPEYQVPYLL